MAELYFDELCRRAGRNDFLVRSAGTCSWDGALISSPAASVLRSLGIASENFRSSRLTPELADEFDLIIAMTAGHRRDILEIAPRAAGKVKLLLDYAGGGDVPDPYGGSVAHYNEVFSHMKPALENLAAELFKSK